LHHIHEGEERKTEEDHSDWEMENLDWDVLGQPPNKDTITECDSTGPLTTSLTCEQRQATIWAQDDVRESERIATQKNMIESEVEKQDYPDSEMDEWDWDETEASPFKETTTAIKQPATLP